MTANKPSVTTPSAITTSSALYTDLSGYYDLMCADFDYHEQSNYARWRDHRPWETGAGNAFFVAIKH